jgi:hypothetical protein
LHPKPVPRGADAWDLLSSRACLSNTERQRDKERAPIIFFRSLESRGDGGGADSAGEVDSGGGEERREGQEVDAHTWVVAEGRETDRSALAMSTGARIRAVGGGEGGGALGLGCGGVEMAMAVAAGARLAGNGGGEL